MRECAELMLHYDDYYKYHKKPASMSHIRDKYDYGHDKDNL